MQIIKDVTRTMIEELASKPFFVWMDFVKPSHSKFETLHLEQITLKLVPSVRSEDPRVVEAKPVAKDDIPLLNKVFNKDSSMFKPWIEDNFLTINECMENDKKYWKVQKICKDKNDYQEIVNVFT